MKSEKIPLYQEFIENLKKIKKVSRGDLAKLKRACGYKIAESRNALGIFYRYLPSKLVRDYNEEIYFLVATLYGLNDYPYTGSFGKSMQEVYRKAGSESIAKRMIALLDSDFEESDELSYRLRQCVKLAASHQVGIDWLQLLKDLIYWTHEDKFVQKNWARDFYSKLKSDQDAGSKNNPKNNSKKKAK